MILNIVSRAAWSQLKQSHWKYTYGLVKRPIMGMKVSPHLIVVKSLLDIFSKILKVIHHKLPIAYDIEYAFFHPQNT